MSALGNINNVTGKLGQGVDLSDLLRNVAGSDDYTLKASDLLGNNDDKVGAGASASLGGSLAVDDVSQMLHAELGKVGTQVSTIA